MKVTVENNIKIINLGEKGPNLLSVELQKKIIEEFNPNNCKAIIFKGNNKIFSAGLNLKHLMSSDKEGVKEIFEIFGTLLQTIRKFPGPVISIVSGHAIAGGCLLALACDYRYGMFGLHRMGLNEMALGLDLPKPILDIITHNINRNHLFEVSTQCKLYSPRMAFDRGLINEYISNPFIGKKLATKSALKKAINLSNFYIQAGEPFSRLKKSLLDGTEFNSELLVENWFNKTTQKKISSILEKLSNK